MSSVGIHSFLSDADKLSKTQLDQELRMQSMAVTQLRALTRPDKFFGAHKGQSVQVSKMLKMSVSTTPISELTETPVERTTINYITVTVEEYGKATGWTGKAATLSQIALDESLKKAISINQQETIDKIAWERGFEKADYFAIPTGTSASPTVTFQSGASPTTSATRHIQLFDLRQVVTEFKKNNVPKYDGAYYVGVFSAGAMGRLFEDAGAGGTFELYKYDMPEVLIRGEFGTYYGLRMVEETNALSNVLGTTNFAGEAVICGFEPVVEALAEPENIRDQSYDFRRQHQLGWFVITGFAPLWSRVSDGFFTIIRITSA